LDEEASVVAFGKKGGCRGGDEGCEEEDVVVGGGVDEEWADNVE